MRALLRTVKGMSQGAASGLNSRGVQLFGRAFESERSSVRAVLGYRHGSRQSQRSGSGIMTVITLDRPGQCYAGPRELRSAHRVRIAARIRSNDQLPWIGNS